MDVKLDPRIQKAEYGMEAKKTSCGIRKATVFWDSKPWGVVNQ